MNKNLSNLLVPSEISTWSYKNEIIAALVNFLTAGYIIAVNPEILSHAGMSKSALVSAKLKFEMEYPEGRKEIQLISLHLVSITGIYFNSG